MREIEFYNRDGIQLAGVHYGNKVYVAPCEDVLKFCADVESQVRLHINKPSLKIDEDTIKDMARQVACIQAVLRNDADVEKISMYANVLASILDRLLTSREPDAPKSAPVCTCSMDDGIHEWNCALETARRLR